MYRSHTYSICSTLEIWRCMHFLDFRMSILKWSHAEIFISGIVDMYITGKSLSSIIWSHNLQYQKHNRPFCHFSRNYTSITQVLGMMPCWFFKPKLKNSFSLKILQKGTAKPTTERCSANRNKTFNKETSQLRTVNLQLWAPIYK
jgi:hypothetical protein